ncbi:hypothetical protein AB0904_24910 [Streptomyces sp. NPDC006684]|uniref:hypothetical protein n=1 Tax=Streptomyces sp. NPDC006684 TaxID=3154477 RepID=UPI003456275F
MPIVEKIRPLVAQRILVAGHGSLNTTQRYPHPHVHKITAAGAALSAPHTPSPTPSP